MGTCIQLCVIFNRKQTEYIICIQLVANHHDYTGEGNTTSVDLCIPICIISSEGGNCRPFVIPPTTGSFQCNIVRGPEITGGNIIVL